MKGATCKDGGSSWMRTSAALAILLVFAALGRAQNFDDNRPVATPGHGQTGALSQASYGFQEVDKTFRIEDLDGRPWVEEKTVGVRLDQTQVTGLESLPDPLVVNENLIYSKEDPSFSQRFNSQRSAGTATVTVQVAAPDNVDEHVPYELAFFKDGRKLAKEIKFGANAGEIRNLPSTLRVPVHSPPPSWQYYVGFLAYLILLVFAIYLPFYRWRLSRGTPVEVARDYTLFLWWLFSLVGYGIMLYFFYPRSLPYMIFLGLIGLITLFSLIIALRPHRKPRNSALA